MMIRRTFFGVAALAALSLYGCNGGSGSSGASETSTTTTSGTTGGATASTTGKVYKIAVIPKGSTHEYWKSVHEGANKASDELKDVEIEWSGPEKEDDKDSQVSMVEDFVSKGVDGMVLAPLDDKVLSNPVKDAAKANIPVVIIDSGVVGDGFISYIATDNEKGGEMAGDYLAKLLGGKGKVIMLRYEAGSASTDAREKGFLVAMKRNPGIQVVSDDQYGGATVDQAMKASENVLATHKKGAGLDIDGIYTPNESTTFGMLRTLTTEGVAGKVKFVGFDASDQLIKGLTDGYINGLILQDPRKMGYLGVKTVEMYLKGNKTFPKTVDTGATLVTKDNMSTPDIAKLLAPPKV